MGRFRMASLDAKRTHRGVWFEAIVAENKCFERRLRLTSRKGPVFLETGISIPTCGTMSDNPLAGLFPYFIFTTCRMFVLPCVASGMPAVMMISSPARPSLFSLA